MKTLPRVALALMTLVGPLALADTRPADARPTDPARASSSGGSRCSSRRSPRPGRRSRSAISSRGHGTSGPKVPERGLRLDAGALLRA